MKKIFALAMVAAAALAGCKDGESVTPATGFDAKESTVKVKQGGSVDLRTLFTANGADAKFSFAVKEQPNSFSTAENIIASVPTTIEYEAYSIDADGYTLKSDAAVRVPDVLTIETFDSDGDGDPTTGAAFTPTSHEFARDVNEGVLTVTLTLADGTKKTADYAIEQTDKAALPAPTINFVPKLLEEGGNRYFEKPKTSGAKTSVTITGLFTVTPIDYAYSNPRLSVFLMNAPTYLSMEGGNVMSADQMGTTDYVWAYYNAGEPQALPQYGASLSYAPSSKEEAPAAGHEGETLEAYKARVQAAAVAANAETAAPKVYVHITNADPQVIGLELNPNIGLYRNRSFYRNVTVPASRMVIATFDNGERMYGDVSGIGGEIVAGNVSGKGDAAPVFKGVAGLNSTDALGSGATEETTMEGDQSFKTNGASVKIYGRSWFGNLNAFKTASSTPKAPESGAELVAPVGSEIEFTVTHKQHFMEPGWTVVVKTTVKAADTTWPETEPAA